VNTPFRSSPAGSAVAVLTAIAVVLSGGATLTTSTAADQPGGSSTWSLASPRFVDKQGPVLPSPQLYLIYWGTGWLPQAAPTPTPVQVTRAVRTLMATGYLTGLTQYRGSGRGELRGSALVTSSDPPDGFTDEHVAEFVDAQLTSGIVPGPDAGNQTVYGVVMPAGVTPESAARTGEHNYYTRSGQRIYYAWFSNQGYLEAITGIVSHELVESATDPEGSGFVGVKGTCDESGWCEIADVCASTWWVLDGVTVQGYWSNRDNECIVPGSATPERPEHAAKSGEAPDHAPPPGHTQVEADHPPAAGHTQVEAP
jgi:hypothetical protein